MKRTSAVTITGYAGLVLSIAVLFYFLRLVDISLIYCWQQTVPLPLGDCLHYPGGISDHLAARLMELMTLPYLGKIAVVLLVVIVFFSLQVTFRRMKDNPLYFTLLLAALIPFILLFAHYRLPAGLIIDIAAGFLLAAVQSLYSPRKLLAGSGYNFITGVVVYMIAGAPGLIILIQVAVIQAVLKKKYLELVSVLPLLIIPLCFLPVLDLLYTVRNAYLDAFLIPGYEIPSVVFLSLLSPILLLLVYFVFSFILSRFAVKNPWLISGAGIIVVLAGIFFSSKDSINETEKSILSVAQASLQGDWEKVLQLTSGQNQINKIVQFEINRALYHTGRLLDDMFHYPQQFGEQGIFLEYNYASSVAIHMSKFYSDLGFVNEARHWACEAHIGSMRHPIALQQMIKSYIAIGNLEMAQKYMRILSGSLLHRDWLDGIRMMIENNTAHEDPEIKSYLANNPEFDYFASTKFPTEKLKAFYTDNRSNRMAFEYLIASYLLQHKLGNLVNSLQGFRDLGYEKLPEAVEEALLIYVAKTDQEENPELTGFTISMKKIEEFQEFSRLVLDSKSKREGMVNSSKYRNTYWYYVLYTSPHVSGE